MLRHPTRPITAGATAVVVAAALMTGVTSPARATSCDASDGLEFFDCWANPSFSTVRLTNETVLTIGGTRFELAGDTTPSKTLDLNGRQLNVPEGFGVPIGTTLTITDTAAGEASGQLSVTAPATGRAGIGGAAGETAGTIIIDGAAVEVAGGIRSAGIGGGDGGSGGTIEIRAGAAVTALGGSRAPGIGGGDQGTAGTITIEDLDTTVTATGGNWGAGIGGSNQNGGGTIQVRAGADVTATGGGRGAGIGGGRQAPAGTITIEGTDTTVTATGGIGGAGIGGGNPGSGGTVTIDGAEVNATGGDSGEIGGIPVGGGAGIGGGGQFATLTAGDGGSLTVEAGTVNAHGGTGQDDILPGPGVGSGGVVHGTPGGLGPTVTVKDGEFDAVGGTSNQATRNAPGVGTSGNPGSPDSVSVGILTAAGRALEGTRINGGEGGDQGGLASVATFSEDALVWAALLTDPDIPEGTGYASLRFADGTPAEITTSSLPAATQGQPYSAPITTSGEAPVTLALTGGTLPAGLTFDGNTITGTPTESGSFDPEFTASNTILGLVQSSSSTLPLTVAGAGPGPTPTKESQQLRAKQVPKRIKPQGATVLNRKRATTRQGVPVSATALIRGISARGDVRCHRLIRGPGRKLTIRTNGRCAFTLVVRYRAKATDEYRALNIKQRYRVKKAKRFR